MKTNESAYTKQFLTNKNKWFRAILPLRVPIQYNIRRLCKGKVLDVGCGPGRHVTSLSGRAVGVDHNNDFVEIVRNNGFEAYTPEELEAFQPESTFDTLLFSHVIEHSNYNDARLLVLRYVKYLKSNGKIIIIVPQIAGYRSDKTHMTYFDENLLRKLAKSLNIKIRRIFSYPFPGMAGHILGCIVYNELILIGKMK